MEVCILLFPRIYRIIITCMVLLCSTVVFAQNGKNVYKPLPLQEVSADVPIFFEEPERKDPFIAGVLSWSWSGLGQFYTQNYKKGSAFLVADIAEKSLLVYMLFHISDEYSHGSEDVNWSDIDKKDQYMVVGLLFSIFFTRVFSVVDAVNSAHGYNKNIYYPYWKSKQSFKTSFENTSSNKSICLMLSHPVDFQ